MLQLVLRLHVTQVQAYAHMYVYMLVFTQVMWFMSMLTLVVLNLAHDDPRGLYNMF